MKTENDREQINGYFLLPKEFIIKGFSFKQLFRDDKFAIYSKEAIRKTRREKRRKKRTFYEAIKIKKNEEWERFGRVFPAGETYPNEREFGRLAKECVSLARAEYWVEEWRKEDLKRVEKEKV